MLCAGAGSHSRSRGVGVLSRAAFSTMLIHSIGLLGIHQANKCRQLCSCCDLTCSAKVSLCHSVATSR